MAARVYLADCAGIVQLPRYHRARAAVAQVGDCAICTRLYWTCKQAAHINAERQQLDHS